jgi:tetratricopeptide (TPR) repeat protein
MANLEKYKERARKYELKEQWAKAIEEYVKSIEEMEAAPDAEADLSIYNRVGDLYQKVGEGQNAVVYYERAVDKYQETGFSNNAIALCNKVLRIAPGRAQVYLKLGMLFASKGFAAEAKTNLLEYADRMQKAGQLEEAFKALKKFAEMTPGQDEVWSVLAQQARASARTPDQKEQVEKLLVEFEAKERSHLRKSRASRHMITGEELPPEKPTKKGDLIFLDLEPTPRKSAPGKAPPEVVAPPAPPPREKVRAKEIEVERPVEPDIPLLDLEPTALVSDEEASAMPPLEIQTSSLADEMAAAEPEPLELEPTSLAEEAAPVAEAPAAAPSGEVEWIAFDEHEDIPPSAELAGQEVAAEEVPVEAPDVALPELAAEAAEEPPAAVAEEPAAVEELELIAPEPEEVTAEPLAEAEAAEPEEAVREGAAVAGLPMLDMDEVEAPVEEVEAPVEEAETAPAVADLEFLDVGDVVVAAPTVEELEAQIAQHADDWEAHRRLGETLIEAGQRERAFAEFDAALEGMEQAEDLNGAYAVTEELLRLDPNSVRYHQKRVELAYRQGDRQRLAGAYLELADALLRSGEAEKAVAVYQRVLEHDPGNARAKSAIETLAPSEPLAPAAPAAPAPVAAAPAGGFVDFGAMLLEDDGPKNTRMRIEDEEPSGDEQKDFQTMLAAFKKGVEANVEEEDFQSHYDLGVAYKEMGLLDEAIAEFQKSLRGVDGRLKGSEALGLCFFEKGQFTVAETILRRALELPAHGDAERVGLLYWLGRTQEELGKSPDALASYNRVFAVDITFQDVNQRVKSLSRAGV